MTMKEFNIIDPNNRIVRVLFFNEARGTRNGFAHDTTLFIDGAEMTTAHAYYLNRTWERYQFESVMLAAVYDLKKARIDEIKARYKLENNLTGIRSAAQKAAVDGLIRNDYYINLYQTISDAVRA